MKLKEWRTKKGYSQALTAEMFNEHARKMFPETLKTIKQRALAYWEDGVVPRKFWLRVIEDFTGHKVLGSDFANTEPAAEVNSEINS